MKLICVLNLALASTLWRQVDAFMPPTLMRRSTAVWSDAAPSDSAAAFNDADDDNSASAALDTQAAPYKPTTGSSEAMVTNILDLIPPSIWTAGNGNNGSNGAVSSEQRALIQEALYQLEAVNPTSRPALSPLLNGVWELRYVGGYAADWALPSPTRQLALFLYSGGYSPGVFAYSLAQQLPSALLDFTSDTTTASTATGTGTSSSSPIQITISRAPQQPRVEATVSVKLLGGVVQGQVSVKARLEVESDMRLRETYESVSLPGQSNPTNIPSAIRYARDLYVTYLDEDLLIVRDASGVPEVLVRPAKKFSRNWGTEPSSIDDLVPPGDGQDAQF